MRNFVLGACVTFVALVVARRCDAATVELVPAWPCATVTTGTQEVSWACEAEEEEACDPQDVANFFANFGCSETIGSCTAGVGAICADECANYFNASCSG